MQDGVAAVAEIDLFELEQGVGQVFGRGEGEVEAAVEVGRGDELEFGQGFNSALGLFGLGGFGFEAVDKGLEVLDVRLLFAIGSLLVGKALGALLLVEVVVAAVAVQLALGELDGVVGGGVEEVAVVGDDDLGTGQGGEVAFQPQHGFEVEVVGGFVEQEQVGAVHEGLGKVEAHAPAAGKGFNGAVVFGLAKPKPVQ